MSWPYLPPDHRGRVLPSLAYRARLPNRTMQTVRRGTEENRMSEFVELLRDWEPWLLILVLIYLTQGRRK